MNIAGARMGDFAEASPQHRHQYLVFSAYAYDTNVVAVTLTNNTGSTVDLASSTVRVLVKKTRNYADF